MREQCRRQWLEARSSVEYKNRVDTKNRPDYGLLMTNTDRFSALPLRQRKRARTRFALLEALVPRLEDRTLDDISVAELCADVEISPATFFNYFPAKGDLLTWFIQLWSLRVSAVARRIGTEHDTALGAIEALFQHSAGEMAQSPGVTLEIMAHQARMPVDLVVPEVELADRLLHLPDTPEVEELSDRGLGGVLPELLGAAVVRGELPADADVGVLTALLSALFLGLPLALGRRQAASLGPLFARQLGLVWAGVRAGEGS